jgi:superfamily I DNA/RNA helicase
VVFICGVEDGLIPYRDRGADLEEERRLFYVGLTRAKDRAVLVQAGSRTWRGKKTERRVSPFVEMIPEEALEVEAVTVKERERTRQMSLF